MSAIASWILSHSITAILGWLLYHFQLMWKDYQDKKADEAATAAAVQQLKDAKTKDEKDAAAEGIAKNV